MLVFVSIALASPREEVLALAERAYTCAIHSGAATDTGILTVIDYDRASTEKRRAVAFSNVEGSFESSLGLYRTGTPYVGKHGRSLSLDGLDAGWNNHARAREIVIHRADYATDAFVTKWGRLGRSLGCPALDPAVTDAVIDTIQGGTLVFAYAADAAWLASSKWLGCDKT